MDDLQYLVTGTGRCGTVFMARFLTSVGIPCGHETVFNINGRCDFGQWKLSDTSLQNYNEGNSYPIFPWVEVEEIVADASYMAVPFLKTLKQTKVIHVVRHPCRVINSFCNYIKYFESSDPDDQYEKFIYFHLPELRNESLTNYERAALFYVMWNEKIESDFFLRIEDDKSALLNYLGKSVSASCFNEQQVNSYKVKGRRFDIRCLKESSIKRDLISRGEKYGYNMDSEVIMIM